MKVLFVTSRFPFPLVKGDKVRGYYPIKHLSARHAVDLLSFSEDRVPGAAVREMERYCGSIRVVVLNKVMFHLRLGAAIASSVPSQVFCYRSSAMRRQLAAMCRENNYDVVHFVCGRIADYAPLASGAATVLDWIDALSVSTRRMAQQDPSPLMRWLYRWEARKIAAFERRHLGTCQRSVVTSPVDRQALDETRVELLPNGVDADVFAPREGLKDIDLVFTGNMSYFPNVQGVDFFCREVLPAVRERHPGAKFFVAGINPSRAVLKWRDQPGVTITGYVEDMPAILNRSRIFVAPLLSGAGIQNKILEAMACALPVVTTPGGAAGLGSAGRRGLLVAETASDMAAAIDALLRSAERRCDLGWQCRSVAVERFSWDAMAARLEEIYQELCAAKGGAGASRLRSSPMKGRPLDLSGAPRG